jgi:hypothetical protein
MHTCTAACNSTCTPSTSGQTVPSSSSHPSGSDSSSSSSTGSQSSGSGNSISRDNSASSGSTSQPHSSLDRREAAKFAALADQWWDTSSGPFAALHALNTARCSFLRQGLCSLRGLNPNKAEPLAGLKILDVGCGGGLLSEPVARMGAQVTGIDVSAEGVAAAAAHAACDPLLQQRIRWAGWLGRTVSQTEHCALQQP